MSDEKRLKAMYHIQDYQRRLWKAFDKKVRIGDLKLGDLVLKAIQFKMQMRSSSKIGQAHTLLSRYTLKSSKVDGLRCKPFSLSQLTWIN